MSYVAYITWHIRYKIAMFVFGGDIIRLTAKLDLLTHEKQALEKQVRKLTDYQFTRDVNREYRDRLCK